VTVEVQSECAHCGRALYFALDSELRWSFSQAGADPDLLLFEPDVDWKQFDEPNIIHAY
jgi:hypothetical protein